MQANRWISAAAVVFAGACLASSARADDFGSFQSWTDFDQQYATAIDRTFQPATANVKATPNAIGGGPTTAYEYEEVVRVYRTPSANDGFWGDFHARYDQAIGAVENAANRGWGGGPNATDEATPSPAP